MTPVETATLSAMLHICIGAVAALVLLVIFCIYLAFRNEKVYKRRCELILEERDATLEKIRRGILAEADYDSLPGPWEMLLQFWVPLSKFKRTKA